jgi:hypothetical protein
MVLTGSNVPANYADAVSEFDSQESAEVFARRVAVVCARKGWAVSRVVREAGRVTYVLDSQGRAF